MILYKYKSAFVLQHLLDITVHERLFCQEYSKLNDPFEGQFRSLVRTGGGITTSIVQPLTRSLTQPLTGGSPRTSIRYRDVSELPFNETRVCSLSSDPHDVRMWSLYADSHQGVAVEIDFGGIQGNVHEVHYEPELPKFGSTLLTNPVASEVLTRKTTHWAYEKEYRIVGDQPYFDVAGRIRRVVLGIRASPEVEMLLVKILRPEVDIVRAELDHAGVRVRFGASVRASLGEADGVA